ncbi:RNA polymerase sigma factor [Bowmanella denitrificans]|uniref:RNA polymerase sigma factor n=1 Tax=Bowmanella denitrificans TaxID=366582 RepID=UPI001C0F34B1|nr:sigma factor [Bowmanella denitrificans]
MITKNKYYRELLGYAHKLAWHADEAEDLLQTALLAAVETGRTDMSCVDNRRWLMGAIRNQSAFCARTAIRRRKREASFAYLGDVQTQSEVSTTCFVNTLPASLKTTALLALTGHTKAEIAWLLRLSDAALRQRIVQIKRRWRLFDGSHVLELKGLKSGLAFGRIRQALLKLPGRQHVTLASHDPDGHLFMLGSQNGPARQHRVISTQKEEKDNV